jgi:methyl-accepting chemotaxis protein
MKVKKFNDWSIFSKIIVLNFLFAASILSVFEFYFLPKVSDKIYNNHKKELSNAIDIAYSVTDNLQLRVDKGELTLDQAKAEAFDFIHHMKFNEKDYLFVNDVDGYCRVSQNLANVGKNFSSDTDAYGTYSNQEMVKISKRDGGGYAVYHWDVKGEIVSKLYCFRLFKPWGWVITNGMLLSQIEDNITQVQIAFHAAFFIVLIFFSLVVYGFAKNITSPIKKLAEGAKKVSEGDYSVLINVKSANEVGSLANAFNIMVGNIRSSIENINKMSDESKNAAQKANEAKAAAEEQSKYLAESVNEMLEAINKFSNGDLTVALHTNRKDDIGRMFEGFNKAVENIRSMLERINEAVSSTASASSQISASAEEMAAGSSEQNLQANEVAAAVEEMTKTILSSSENAKFAADTASLNGKIAKEGGDVVVETVNGMNKIAEVVLEAARIVEQLGANSNQIGEIIQVIDDIADQTNLLALNAAIEAARAGEQGRGFAVVADEVRKLAERTTKATKEIAGMIKQIQSNTKLAVSSIKQGAVEVEKGKDLAQKAGSSLNQIIEEVDKSSQLINQLAVASEQQSQSSEQISQSIERISSVINESSVGIQEIARSSEDLNRLTLNLQNLIAKFKIKSEHRKN